MKEKQFTPSHVKEIKDDGTVRFRLTEKRVDRTVYPTRGYLAV